MTVQVTGGSSGTDYSLALFDDPDVLVANDLTNFISYSTSQGSGNSILWGNNPQEFFYVTFGSGTSGPNRVLEVADPDFEDAAVSPSFDIVDCSTLSVRIGASAGRLGCGTTSVTLTANVTPGAGFA